MKNEPLKHLIDRRLSGLHFERQQAVLQGLAMPPERLPRQRLRLVPAMAIVLSLLLAGVALAIGLSLSGQFQARQQAVGALEEAFGLNEETLGMFELTMSREGAGWVIRLTPKGGYPAGVDVGEYRVDIPENGEAQASWTHQDDPAYDAGAGMDTPIWGHPQLLAYLRNKNAYYAAQARIDWAHHGEWTLEEQAQVDALLARALPYGESLHSRRVLPEEDDLQPEAARELAIAALMDKYGVAEDKLTGMREHMAFYQREEDGVRGYSFTFTPAGKEKDAAESFSVVLHSPSGKVESASWYTDDPALRTLPGGSLKNHADTAREYMEAGTFDMLSARDKALLAARLQEAGLSGLLNGQQYILPGEEHLTEAEGYAAALAVLTEAYGIDAAHLHLFEASLSLIPEKEGAAWRLALTPLRYDWPTYPEAPVGAYTALADGSTGQAISASWSLEGVDDGVYTAATWGQAKAYSAAILPWFSELYEKYIAILNAAADRWFLTVPEAAACDQLFRDAGFPEKNFIAGMPRPDDISQEQAIALAREALIQVQKVPQRVLDEVDFIHPFYAIRTGYQLFEWDAPFWSVTFHHVEGVWYVALDAATGDVLYVSYDPMAAGNG
jgi:hypothetical protein